MIHTHTRPGALGIVSARMSGSRTEWYTSYSSKGYAEARRLSDLGHYIKTLPFGLEKMLTFTLRICNLCCSIVIYLGEGWLKSVELSPCKVLQNWTLCFLMFIIYVYILLPLLFMWACQILDLTCFPLILNLLFLIICGLQNIWPSLGDLFTNKTTRSASHRESGFVTSIGYLQSFSTFLQKKMSQMDKRSSQTQQFYWNLIHSADRWGMIVSLPHVSLQCRYSNVWSIDL